MMNQLVETHFEFVIFMFFKLHFTNFNCQFKSYICTRSHFKHNYDSEMEVIICGTYNLYKN